MVAPVLIDPSTQLAQAIADLTAKRDNELESIFQDRTDRKIGHDEAMQRGGDIKAQWRKDIFNACSAHFLTMKELIDGAAAAKSELQSIKNPAALMPWER